jgi:hypothetical protein
MNAEPLEYVMHKTKTFIVAATLVTIGAGAVAFAQTQPAPQAQPTAPGSGATMGSGGMGMMGMGQGGMGMMGMGGMRQGGMGQGGMSSGGMGSGGMGMMGSMMGMEMMEMGAMGQGVAPQAQPGTQPGMQMPMSRPMGPGTMGPGTMGMGRGSMGMGAGMVDRVEGRIAFLRAELKITDQQTAPFNEFADALRAGAKRHNEMRQHMMTAPTTSMAARLEEHERLLNARLESTRAVRGALGRLQAVLSEEQRRTLDELVATL